MYSHTDINNFKSVLKPLVDMGAIQDEVFQVAVNALKDRLIAVTNPKESGRDKLISRKEAAEILDCCTRTVIRLEEDGQITPVRYSKAAVKYKESEVLALMECRLNRGDD